MAHFPSVGEEFGGYRITRQLGRGGMGVVFAAEQRGLGRTVALKVLSPEFAEQPDYRARFAREATVLARLDSPHVIAIFDHGEQDGCLYIATQYVGGGDLSDAIRRHGPVPAVEAATIAEQMAWALRDSHAAGVVHRDLKPSNVLLRGVGSETYAYLCDFGIAQDRTPGNTVTGAVAGTFAYLAPERLRGEPATAAADIYALGCVLWTMVVGSAPYAGSDVQIGMSHLNAPVPRLVDDSPVARAVNDVLQRALAKEPGRRYPDAGAMRADLRELARVAGAPHPPLRPFPTAAPSWPPAPPSAPSSASAAAAAAAKPSHPGPPSHPSRPSQPSLASQSSAPGAPWLPPPPSFAGPPAPRRRRTGLVVAGVVAAVVTVVGGVAVAVVANDGGGDPVADPTGSTSTSTTSSTAPTSPTTTAPTTPVAPTTTETVDPPEPPEPRKTPTPTYPDVPAASGVQIELGAASLRAPSGWGTIDRGIVQDGVGARDYGDTEGYYSSVFIRRSEPVIPITSPELLEIAAEAAVENLDEADDTIELKFSGLMPRAWLDGERAVRIRASYFSTKDNLSFTEETWFAQRGTYLYRVTFQHSRSDSQAARRGQIDPMVVSFRWR
ncbi:serine/threonine-protein kinase [Nocardioides dongxiaopingii]|uniref:serine/threonine-protein kinase n=1 Tax=Nocardioides dongxiaopingii TaxID=2576036 RepID=UPI0010C76967|nr:serine/threonine-protein kinase [Nocardioides dongxiaopingii]